MEPGGGGLSKKDSSKAICVDHPVRICAHALWQRFSLSIQFQELPIKKQGLTDS